MKKKILALMLCMTTMMAFTGCGKGGEETETAEATQSEELRSGQIEIDPEKQVTELCDYKNIPISISGDFDITDEDVTTQMESLIKNLGISTEVTDHTTVQEGDIVKVDFTGYLDGEAFDNGSATDVLIDVSKNASVSGTTYIDGFSQGLLGAEVGSEVSSDVTFPDDYSQADLAGKLTTFKFNVKSICKMVTVDELTDEMVAEYFSAQSITTVQGLKDELKSELESSAKSSEYSAKVSAAKSYMQENCTVNVPADYLAARISEYQKSFIESNGNLADYAAKYNVTEDELKEQITGFVTDQVEVEFIFSVIADKENIQADDDQFSQFVQSVIANSNNGFADENAAYEYFGNGNVEEGETYMKNLYRVNKAIDYVAENAQVTNTSNSTESTVEDTQSTENE